MSFGTVVVILAGIIALVIITRTKHAARRDNYRETFGDTDRTQREAELQREVEELRERIQVLERIATEGGDTARLAAEIEKLRDK